MSTIDQIVESGERPLVSAIMPHWKALPYIREAMESVVRQTFLNNGGDLELIVIDDGSQRDVYAKLIEIFQLVSHFDLARYVPITLDAVPRHSGKNRALEYAKRYINKRSRYTFVADSDDVFAPEFVQNLSDALEKARKENPNVIMAYSDSILIDGKGVCCGIATAPDYNRNLYFGLNGAKRSNFIPGNALVVTERFREGVPSDLDASEWDKWLRHTAELRGDGIAIRVKDVENKPRRDYFYRQQPDQMSGHGKQLEEREFFARWPEHIPKPHHKTWSEYPRKEQIKLLKEMPETDTRHWNQYRSAQS